MVETPAKRGKYARAGPLGNVIDDALFADFRRRTSVPAPDPQLDSGGPLSVQLDRVALPARPGPGVAPLRDPHRSPSPWPRDRSAPSPDPAHRTRREDSSPGRSTPDHSGHAECDPLPLLRLRPRGHRLGPLPRVRTRVRPRESRDLRIATTRFAGASRHRPRDRPRRGGVRIASVVVGMALRRLASRGVSNDLRNRRGARRGRSAPGGPQPIVVRAHSAPARGSSSRARSTSASGSRAPIRRTKPSPTRDRSARSSRGGFLVVFSLASCSPWVCSSSRGEGEWRFDPSCSIQRRRTRPPRRRRPRRLAEAEGVPRSRGSNIRSRCSEHFAWVSARVSRTGSRSSRSPAAAMESSPESRVSEGQLLPDAMLGYRCHPKGHLCS
jgi:hypothetical protein